MNGFRAIAPDLVGFGRSDKPANREDYTYKRHVAWITALVLKLDLTQITLVCQDWGGLIGLRIAAEHPDRVGSRPGLILPGGYPAATLLRPPRLAR